MKKENIVRILSIIGIVILLLVLSWEMVLGAGLALASVFYFGEQKVKIFLKGCLDKASQKIENFKEERKSIIIDNVQCSPSQTGFQLVVIAEGKSYLLKERETDQIPESLQKGQKVTLIIRRKFSEDTIISEEKKIITSDNQEFEVCD